MTPRNTTAAFVLGILLSAGLVAMGYLVSSGVLTIKSLERSVSVKGLSEREVTADTAIWPIRFSEVGNDLETLYSALQQKNALVAEFLQARGFAAEEISLSAPMIVDRQAQGYADASRMQYRYTGTSIVTVYSTRVERVRQVMADLADLGKQGIALSGNEYDSRAQFLFTGLNALKPEMIEEATRNAREVAEKFARDSDSRLGKIRRASQGQFTISDRDSNTPHIKRVRVVSTIEYYLSD